MDGPEELSSLSAVAAVRALRAGDVSAEAYAGSLLRRCEQGASLNAFITLQSERVLESARERDRERLAGRPPGPLHGLPIPIKDSVNTGDLPTTAGTAALRHFRPKQDAALVGSLRAAGAIVLGKTNLHELSYGYTSYNHAFGPVGNPYAPMRSPGGSSGGTAAAVAYGMAPLGVAEDTEGSIRVPASLCGIAGFRPTTGRYPTEGCVPITPLFDQIGPHARTVEDLVLFDAVISGRAPVRRAPLKDVRLGVIRAPFYSGLDPEVETICSGILRRLARAGVRLVEGSLSEIVPLVAATTRQVQTHDFRPSLTRYLSHYGACVSFEAVMAQASANVRAAIEPGITPGSREHISHEQYGEIVKTYLPALRGAFARYFADSGVAAIVFPATITAAPMLGEDDMEVEVRGRRMRFDAAISRNIAPGSTAGLPGLVLPAGLTKAGLPVGLELDGPAGCDRALLALGLAIEAEIGTLPPPDLPGDRVSFLLGRA